MSARPDEPAADLIAYLGRRFSVAPKDLALPAPSEAQWTQAAGLALRAPDHGGLRPFRFVVVGAGQRALLGGLFAAEAERRGRPPEDVERARARALNGPGLVAVVARIRPDLPEVPRHEQWLCVGGALTNFVNALHLMGFGAKVLSGASVRAPEIGAAFCGEGETLAAWIVAGTPVRAARPKATDDVAAVIGPWQPG